MAVRSGAADAVVAAARELDKVEAVPERVRHEGDAAVLAGRDLPVEGAAEPDQPGHHAVDIRHDEIEVNRRPVPVVAPPDLHGAEVRDGRAAGEQEYRDIAAGELDP